DEPQGGGAPDDGRGRRRADCHHHRALRGICPGGLHPRHFGSVFPPVCGDDRDRDDPFAVRLAHPKPGVVCPALQATRRAGGRRAPAPAGPRVLPRFQLRLRAAVSRLWQPDALSRLAVVMLIVYGGLIALTGWQFSQAPTGFIPNQDQGYLITVIQLPPGASLARTDAVVRRAAEII